MARTGPAGAQGAVSVFLGRILRDEKSPFGHGSVVRDYLHIDDLTAALIAGLSFQPQRQARAFSMSAAGKA